MLLLDEPSLGLSPKLADEVLAAVKDIVKHGTAVLLAEQNVERLCPVATVPTCLRSARVALSGVTSALRDTEEIRKAFLGG